MDLKEVQISEIKNLNLIYIFTTDNLLIGKSEKYIGVKVVYDNNRTLSLDYKSPYFEKLIKRIIERYNKEKNSRNIILLGDLTKKLINDETLQRIAKPPVQKTEGISMFNTKNYELKKYESYLIDTLEDILQITKAYEAIEITKISGYNNKFIVHFRIGTVDLEMRMIISFRGENHIDFKIGHVKGTNIGVEGTIENNIDNVTVKWTSKTLGLYGQTIYDATKELSEKKITSRAEPIYYSEESETILQSDLELITFYLNTFGINIPEHIIKTSDYNFILGNEKVLNDDPNEIFFERKGAQISINDDSVIIRYQVINGLSKYQNQINVTLSKTIIEITLSKLQIGRENYILIEQKNSNEFGKSYNYKVYKVEDFDFKKPFSVETSYDIETNVSSLYDIQRYIKRKKEETHGTI